jgi:hypothetical protein
MQVGDRVYYQDAIGNGIIVEEKDDQLKVEFLWGKYMHRFSPRKIWQRREADKSLWLYENDLTLTPRPTQKINSVGFGGSRSLDKLVQLISEIPQAQYGHDITINYGSGVPVGSQLSINLHPVYNKLEQCQLMGDLTPPSQDIPCDAMGDDWIVKPYNSIGGRGIEEWDGENHHGKYLQQKINKVREFRVHCFLWADPMVPLIQEKMIDDRNQLCWNKKQGGRFHYLHMPLIPCQKQLDTPLINQMTIMAIDALKRLKYDFGGIDFGLDDEGKLWIFEVNSRMGLREMSLATYKQMFWQLHNLDIKRYKAERWA